jgi:hypothetical protein
MTKALQAGERIEIRGFGTFKVKDKAARQARNPRTGETVPVPAKKVAAFKPSHEIGELLNPAAVWSSGSVEIAELERIAPTAPDRFVAPLIRRYSQPFPEVPDLLCVVACFLPNVLFLSHLVSRVPARCLSLFASTKVTRATKAGSGT